MKKFFAFVMAVTMVMSVMVMGPEKAFAATSNDATVVTTDINDDVDRVAEDFRLIERYVEANPNWGQTVVKTMIGHDGDTIVVSTAWIDDGEMVYETYRYGHDEIAELDLVAAMVNGYYMMNYWMV